jgi:hypothetical protein
MLVMSVHWRWKVLIQSDNKIREGDMHLNFRENRSHFCCIKMKPCTRHEGMWWNGGIVPLIFNLELIHGSEWSTVDPDRLTSGGRALGTLLAL